MQTTQKAPGAELPKQNKNAHRVRAVAQAHHRALAPAGTEQPAGAIALPQHAGIGGNIDQLGWALMRAPVRALLLIVLFKMPRLSLHHQESAAALP
jgi:hypothetical protein